ncbi:AAA family ATPase [uncultured Rubinisphaera sp.]|uniref:AAA family ATPase n=1 Tax=uncultured Rubinisphaera sp. TaxID=1678686 RepID=UPI0030DCBFD9
MSLTEQLTETVRSGFAGIWIQTCEPDEALLEMARLCQEQEWQLATWDIDQGFHLAGDTGQNIEATDPLSAVRSFQAMPAANAPTLLALVNFHRFLGSAELVQAISHQLMQGKQQQQFLVILAPVVQLPTELEKLFLCIEHELPQRSQLAEIATSLATEPGELPEGPELDRVLEAAGGLTRYEAEGAFSLSLVRQGRLEPEAIWEIKSQTLTRSGLLSLHRGNESFATLGGLDSLKSFCLRALQPRTNRPSVVRSRGVMLLGVPGTGKSAFAKSLGQETGRPTITLDVGALLGSLVGQSEERTRKALQIVDAMQPAILFIDEAEKALGGSSGQSDSGVSTRMLGSLLTWLNDHTSDIFVICTANDVRRLPPEFLRAERFDGLFFLDLPGQAQKQAIWQMYLQQFEITEQELPEDKDWTGAEIRACCRLAALLDLSLLEAAQQIVLVATTSAEAVEHLRRWASGRCLSAEQSGLYSHSVTSERRNPSPTSPQPNWN